MTESYDWSKVDALIDEIGVENNVYYADGALAMRAEKIDIFYDKNSDAETMVFLEKLYETSGEETYKLRFEKHYYNLVDGHIVSVAYSSSFHYTDIVYNLQTVDIDHFIGDEKFENLRSHSFYQVENIKIQDGKFLSCDFSERSVLGAVTDDNFELPEADFVYFNELMSFGFEKTSAFFSERGLDLPY